jgi:hypothetical protein
MRFAYTTVLLFTSAALAQTADLAQSPTPVNATTGALHAASALAPDTPVITVIGLCDGANPRPNARPTTAKQASVCKTVITREQFDALADAIQLHMSATGKAQLAAFYPKLLLMQREFQKLDLGSDPKVKKSLAFAMLRAQAEETAKLLKSKSDDAPSDSEVESYYHENAASYEQTELLRLFVPEEKAPASVSHGPREPQAAVAPTANDDPFKRKVELLQARAAAGEDFDILQLEVYKSAGLAGTPPKTNIGNLTANEMPVNQRSVMSLKVGEVSQALPAANGFYIYKVVSKSTKPLTEVRGQIRAKLAEQVFTDSMQRIENSAKVEYNRTYFPMGADAMATMNSSSLLSKGLGAKGAGTRGARGVRPSVSPRVAAPTPQTSQQMAVPPQS